MLLQTNGGTADRYVSQTNRRVDTYSQSPACLHLGATDLPSVRLPDCFRRRRRAQALRNQGAFDVRLRDCSRQQRRTHILVF